jgi:hypothetical protein
MRAFDRERDASVAAHYARAAGGRIVARDHVLVFESNSTRVGYAVYRSSSRTRCTIVWLYAPGYGKKVLSLLVAELRGAVRRIDIGVSIDPAERAATVIRRINFWFGVGFRVSGIRFRPGNGPLLRMFKII